MNRFQEVYLSLTPEALEFFKSKHYTYEHVIFILSFANDNKEFEVGLSNWNSGAGIKGNMQLIFDHIADPVYPFGYLDTEAKKVINHDGFYTYTITLLNGGTVLVFTNKIDII
jgi:hypothetical protein